MCRAAQYDGQVLNLPQDCGPACLQHVLGAALTQLGVPVCADGVCNGLQQARRGAVVHQCVTAQVSCLSHDLDSHMGDIT